MSGSPVVCERCLDVIVSKHRHDFVTCSCGGVSVDGGSDYLKVMWNAEQGVGYHVATPEEVRHAASR